MLFIHHFLTLISAWESLSSATIRNNKLYTVFQDQSIESVKFKVYELKDGRIADTGNTIQTYELENDFTGFDLEFLDISDDSQDSQNKIWMRAGFNANPNEEKKPSYKHWIGYLNLVDMSLKADSSFIDFPTHENFPMDKHTITNITNQFGPALYVTGGYTQIKNKDEFLYSNSFYKYNFATKEWVDMTYLANEKLKPLVGHKSMAIDNRYLVILGGFTEKSGEELGRLNLDETSFNYISLYNLTVFDTFTNSWENVGIKPNIFDTNVATFEFNMFPAVVYNNKIIIIANAAGKSGEKSKNTPSYIGILDYSSKSWNWLPLYNEDGSIYNPTIYDKNIIVYNDQLIIPLANSNPEYDERVPIQVYDILNKRMKSTLKLSNESNTIDPGKETNGISSQNKGLPVYAIVLIALSCITLVLALIYLLYCKNKRKPSSTNSKTQRNGPIQEVWSNPGINNTNIITWDKKDNTHILYTNGSYPKLKGQNTSNIIEFS